MIQPSLWRDVRRWLPGVLISAVALFLVFRFATWQDLATAFQSVQLPNLVAAILLTVISLIVRASAWRVLLGNRPSLRQSFFIINEGYLLNNLFPLRAGEIGRAVFMGKATGLSPFHVLSTIIIERAFDMAFAAVFLLSTLPLALGLDWARPLAMAALGLVAAGLVLLFLMARYSQKVHLIAERISGRWDWFKRLIIPRLDSLLDGLSALKSTRIFLTSLFWIALTWAFWLLIYYVMLLPFAPSAPFWWAIFADALLALGVAIPSAPAALGVYEGALVAALTLLGLTASAALAYAILMHFLQFTISGIFGLWGLAQERRSFSSLLSEIRLPQSSRSE